MLPVVFYSGVMKVMVYGETKGEKNDSVMDTVSLTQLSPIPTGIDTVRQLLVEGNRIQVSLNRVITERNEVYTRCLSKVFII